ncbi:MAG: cytochrome c oxidase subunit 3 [Saprospiraceae bacterium]|nr:cytochrome c oxidase subunit 3 [Saprospiraceae bacterium]
MATVDTVLEHEHEVEEHQGESWDGGKSPFRVSYGKLMMWYFLLSDAFTFAGFLIAYGALRFSSPTWPVPDFVFSTDPFGLHTLLSNGAPLIFVTIMSFLLIISSVTMVRGVQEGHRENKNGVVFWMFLTILGGIGFLSCQAWEWTNLIAEEHMSVTTNPFGTHVVNGEYLDDEHGHPYKEGQAREKFEAHKSYLIHKDHETGEWIQRRYTAEDGTIGKQEFGPKAFGALFFFITGFHGFHVFSGVAFLTIIAINAASGIYVARRNGYEMVEKIGLYWHFVDLVWVFVFLVFYLL